jgi:NAD(P)-dependent dehydrogenase (short-subunit alcohol dehydrogenase family)
MYGMDRIEGKSCIVTGAGSGIGRATAIRLGEEGGRVLCVDLDEAAAGETAAGIDGAEAVGADVSDPRAVERYTALCAERFGGVDVVVNNAGVNIPGVFHEVSDEVVDRTLAVNTKGPL